MKKLNLTKKQYFIIGVFLVVCAILIAIIATLTSGDSSITEPDDGFGFGEPTIIDEENLLPSLANDYIFIYTIGEAEFNSVSTYIQQFIYSVDPSITTATFTPETAKQKSLSPLVYYFTLTTDRTATFTGYIRYDMESNDGEDKHPCISLLIKEDSESSFHFYTPATNPDLLDNLNAWKSNF